LALGKRWETIWANGFLSGRQQQQISYFLTENSADQIRFLFGSFEKRRLEKFCSRWTVS
jgi:hypothetical protein